MKMCRFTLLTRFNPQEKKTNFLKAKWIKNNEFEESPGALSSESDFGTMEGSAIPTSLCVHVPAHHVLLYLETCNKTSKS